MLKNITVQALAFFLLFQLISWIRELPLLSSDEKAPGYTLTSLKGTEFNSNIFNGKPTIVFFWAPWCSVCKVSMPNLQSFYEENGKDINVVSIALSYTSKQEVVDIIEKQSLTFTTLLGNDKTATDYKIKGFPTYYILDANGKVHAKSMGYSSELGIKARTLTL
ncbi:TlpA family protein disulfide reductase [Psychrosphaera aestuarii]|uniref:TlpA family protein disulfide reductase n=1 Tax=Psychrosphaera aestuarii TaxID=1266052 RepID=UPI001B32FEBD|nr:TlpA disulfide reductase family protein [Psychrosphaera aestuarii]